MSSPLVKAAQLNRGALDGGIMTRRALTYASGAVLGTLLLALGVVRVWNVWPPAIRYRLRRNEGAMRVVTARYLGGTVSLDAAAMTLAQRLQAQMELEWRIDDATDGNSARITALAIMFTPPGYSSTDPRIAELAERAMSAWIGPSAYAQAKARSRHVSDSLAHLPPSNQHPPPSRAP
jgi:hypothetical protein